MRRLIIVAYLILSMMLPCAAQNQPPLCPKHIETPNYPPIGITAHVTGRVFIRVTIDANGIVTDADILNKPTDKWLSVLGPVSIDNIQHWTFEKPPSAPYTETVTYDYELDGSLPPSGGSNNLPVRTRVAFDLPDHVNLYANVPIIEPSSGK